MQAHCGVFAFRTCRKGREENREIGRPRDPHPVKDKPRVNTARIEPWNSTT